MNKLTAIISFINEGAEIERTVSSIRETAGGEVDILLINDCSEDDTDYEAVSKQYNARYCGNTIRQGAARSRDIGVERCETPYFILFDGHMRFYQNNWWKIAGVEVIGEDVSIRGDGRVLILVDGIRMIEKLNDLNISEIETIDIFKGPSATIFGVRGSGGVISITLRKGPSTPITSDVHFATYEPLGYQKPVEFYSPKYDTPASKNLETPDYRTTICWKPDLLISEDGNASFDFYTSDFPTTYSVVIEGLSNDGRIVCYVEKIEVR